MFSSRSFVVSSLTFKSSAHSEVTLVCGASWRSGLFAACVGPGSQRCLVKQWSLPHCVLAFSVGG